MIWMCLMIYQKCLKMINFDTREEVVGKNSYVTSDGDIADLFK